MFQPGDRVQHDEFGSGTIVSVDLNAGQSGTALVEWDVHRVSRTNPNLTQSQSHVSLQSLHAKPGAEPEGENG